MFTHVSPLLNTRVYLQSRLRDVPVSRSHLPPLWPLDLEGQDGLVSLSGEWQGWGLLFSLDVINL